MNILVPDSWLREYLETDASVSDIQHALSLCGPSVEKVTREEKENVYDIEITTNRVDMASVYGIAREAASILPRFGFKSRLKPLFTKELTKTRSLLPLTIEDPNHLEDRILAVVMDNVTIGDSPAHMKKRLESSGVRALNNIIDITNYLMLELGYPLHVFDYDRVKTARMLIRTAKNEELLVTLDGKSYKLHPDDAIIDDTTGRIIDLPGIMGTENSVVTKHTKRIIFFIESNNPSRIRKTSIRHGIRTIAAGINEKHPDPELAKTTILRAVSLAKDIAGAKVASTLIDIYPKPCRPKHITVANSFICQRIGIPIPKKETISILTSLHFLVENNDDDMLTVTPPSFRQFDISIPEDIVEEVARIYGYQNLPSILMEGKIPTDGKNKNLSFIQQIKTALKYWGYTEIYTYSFVSKSLLEKAGLPLTQHLRVKNPLTEETEYMRTSLIPSLLTSYEKNQYFTDTLSLFELSKVYIPRAHDLPNESLMLVLATQSDFFLLKGIVEQLCMDWRIDTLEQITSELSSNTFFHPGQSVSFVVNDETLATVATLHPSLKTKFHLQKDTYIAQVHVDVFFKYASSKKNYHPISPFPPAFEDLALLLTDTTKIGIILTFLQKVHPCVKNVRLLDRYSKHITIRVTYQDDKHNLTAEEISHIRQLMLNKLSAKFGIVLKK